MTVKGDRRDVAAAAFIHGRGTLATGQLNTEPLRAFASAATTCGSVAGEDEVQPIES